MIYCRETKESTFWKVAPVMTHCAGGTLADTFVFDEGFDRDVIEDFRLGEDILSLTRDLAGNRNADQVVNAFGDVTANGVELDFGGGDVVLLEGVSSLSALADDIIFA